MWTEAWQYLAGRADATDEKAIAAILEWWQKTKSREEKAKEEITRLREKLAEAESSLAALADTINRELRAAGRGTYQAELGQDLRPYVLALVDAVRVRERAIRGDPES